jgi:hypothetical protein
MARGWETQFQLAVATYPGERFQELFAEIMERRHPGFQRIRPWGPQGDRKNDGWLPAEKTLFQCYAPSSFTTKELEAKLTEDYEGATEHWKDKFTDWVFVHNDRNGMAPSVAQLIQDLDARADQVTCTSWGPFQLREQFASLSEADRVAILGPVLTPTDFMGIGAKTIKPLIETLGAQKPDPAAPVNPVPVGKIEANDLTDEQIAFLTMGAGRAPLVDHYMNNAYTMPTQIDAIATAVADKYRALRDAGQPPAQTLDDMVTWVSGGDIGSKMLANVWAVIAYFFERCHIFEVPAL